MRYPPCLAGAGSLLQMWVVHATIRRHVQWWEHQASDTGELIPRWRTMIGFASDTILWDDVCCAASGSLILSQSGHRASNAGFVFDIPGGKQNGNTFYAYAGYPHAKMLVFCIGHILHPSWSIHLQREPRPVCEVEGTVSGFAAMRRSERVSTSTATTQLDLSRSTPTRPQSTRNTRDDE
ncbi:hypothetical protein EJ06DRAFT_399161 [Trichodelitschia bisporula]|uniref:Uncharacterized protein n=1 Tax=Trichodelitschia bisporula TaxID=703511 RepID=A0A6G1HX18_9PEZI|nr:hypothetical protein EJ06DRAFT_399161 [Trichodelitschia bisporula]